MARGLGLSTGQVGLLSIDLHGQSRRAAGGTGRQGQKMRAACEAEKSSSWGWAGV